VTDLVLAASPLTYVVQHELPGGKIGEGIFGFTWLSNVTIMQVAALLLLIYFIPRFVRPRSSGSQIERMTPKGWGNLIEFLCFAIRKHVAEPNFGKYTDRFVPYLWSAFFFVLTCNLLGLLPLVKVFKPIAGYYIGATSTGNIWVTATLAVCTLGMIVVNGLRLHGLAYVKHFFLGPAGINILIAVLEVIGLVAKTFALTVRLFANMVAGHVLLVVLLSFIAMAELGIGRLVTLVFISPLVVLGSVAINFLELFVAFLQAFIFTFLSAVFIGQAVNLHHDEDHEHEHGHAGEPGQAHATQH
jgi:F-type H+-transporting ATPase subunit a